MAPSNLASATRADLKKRNEIREATRQLIKLFAERDGDGVGNPLELRGASPPQLTATPAADRDNDSLNSAPASRSKLRL